MMRHEIVRKMTREAELERKRLSDEVGIYERRGTSRYLRAAKRPTTD